VDPNYKAVANAGFNAWLESLPADDWGDSFDNWVPVYWDEEKSEWVEGERPESEE